MVWMLHWRIVGNPKQNVDAFHTKEDALRSAKRKQTIPDVRVSAISGPNGEVLTAEHIQPLIKDLKDAHEDPSEKTARSGEAKPAAAKGDGQARNDR